MKIEAINDGMIVNIPTAIVTKGEGNYPNVVITSLEGVKISGTLNRVYRNNPFSGNKLFVSLDLEGFTYLASANIQVRSVDFGSGLTGKILALYATSDMDDQPEETELKYALTAEKTWSYQNDEPYELINIAFTSKFKDILIS